MKILVETVSPHQNNLIWGGKYFWYIYTLKFIFYKKGAEYLQNIAPCKIVISYTGQYYANFVQLWFFAPFL